MEATCISIDRWIDKQDMVHIHTMDYYSAKERTKFESAAVSWKNGEPVIQSEVNYKQKNKYSILMNIDGI